MNKYTKRRSEQDQQVVMIQQQEPSYLPSLGLDLGSSFNETDPRAIWLTTEVYPETIATIVQQIQNINYIDEKKEKEYLMEGQTYVRPPIKLYVSSYGGSVYDGLGLIGIIKKSKTPIHTIAFGKVMSMGVLLAISGHVRFSYPHTTFMIHSISSGNFGCYQELKESLEEDTRLQEKLDSIITSSSNITQERLNEVLVKKLDWYFDADQALEFKMINEII